MPHDVDQQTENDLPVRHISQHLSHLNNSPEHNTMHYKPMILNNNDEGLINLSITPSEQSSH